MELTRAGSMACVRGNEFEKPAARSTMKIQQKAAVFVAAGCFRGGGVAAVSRPTMSRSSAVLFRNSRRAVTLGGDYCLMRILLRWVRDNDFVCALGIGNAVS